MAVVFPQQSWPPDVSVVAGGRLGTDLGLTAGSWFAATTADAGAPLGATVGSVARSPSRVDGVDGALLVPEPARGQVFECLVEVRPGAQSAVGDVIRAWYAPTQVTITPMLREGELSRDTAAELRDRPSQWAAPLAGVLLATAFLGMWWGRRDEGGLYLFLGMSGAGLRLMLTVEAVLVVVAPAVLGGAVAVLTLHSGAVGVVAQAALHDFLKLVLLMALLPVVTSFVFFRRRALDQLRGR